MPARLLVTEAAQTSPDPARGATAHTPFRPRRRGPRTPRSRRSEEGEGRERRTWGDERRSRRKTSRAVGRRRRRRRKVKDESDYEGGEEKRGADEGEGRDDGARAATTTAAAGVTTASRLGSRRGAVLSMVTRKMGPIGLALTAYDIWRRIPPQHRRRLLQQARARPADRSGGAGSPATAGSRYSRARALRGRSGPAPARVTWDSPRSGSRARGDRRTGAGSRRRLRERWIGRHAPMFAAPPGPDDFLQRGIRADELRRSLDRERIELLKTGDGNVRRL